jgi:uncharacterized ParB-like nuclease family protein
MIMAILPGDKVGSESREVFNVARRRAFMQDVLAELSGRSDDLLSFERVRTELNLAEPTQDATLQEIPLERIVGSVGRYRDFTRAFLPRASIDPSRWTRIERLQGKGRLPPIDVFQVGDVYFVRDGNHRVSVARARNHKTILARVVEIPTRVNLRPDTSPDDLILKAGYRQLLEKTSLDQLCPEQQIELTRAGGYHEILQHIEIHQFYMGLRSLQYPSLAEAAADWYRTVYTPVVKRIRDSRILRQFPGRTEADLYLWITSNQARLQMRYGSIEQAQQVVDDFARDHRVPAPLRWLRRLLHRLFPRLLSSEPR